MPKKSALAWDRNSLWAADALAGLRTAIFSALALMSAGCSGRPEDRATPSSSASALVRRPWDPYGNQFPDTIDRGTGVITLAVGPDSGRSFPSEDTLLFRATPRPDAPVVAALIRERPSPGSWSYAALAPAGATLNFLEHDYEESGVPFDSADTSGRWVRAIVAFAPDRTPLHGWASLDREWVRTLAWEDRLAERAWYFVDSASTVVYPTLDAAKTRRGGRPLPAHQFEIRIVERHTPFLRIRMRWPVDVCSEPNDSAQSGEFWVRYLDDRGRPLMFYPPRGC